MSNLIDFNKNNNNKFQEMDEASSPMRKLVPGSVMCGKYKLLEKIGAGSFGMVFKT